MFPTDCYIRHFYQFIFDHWGKSCGTFNETQEVHLNARCWYSAHLSYHKTPVQNASLIWAFCYRHTFVVIMCRQWETIYISYIYAVVIIQNKSPSVHIHNLWTCASSQDRNKERMPVWHFIQEGWKSSHNPTGRFTTRKCFKIKLSSKLNDLNDCNKHSGPWIIHGWCNGKV